MLRSLGEGIYQLFGRDISIESRLNGLFPKWRGFKFVIQTPKPLTLHLNVNSTWFRAGAKFDKQTNSFSSWFVANIGRSIHAYITSTPSPCIHMSTRTERMNSYAALIRTKLRRCQIRLTNNVESSLGWLDSVENVLETFLNDLN